MIHDYSSSLIQRYIQDTATTCPAIVWLEYFD